MNAEPIAVRLIDGSFSIHRFSSDAPIPAVVLREPFFAVLRSATELSLVCPASVEIDADKTSSGWSCLEVVGPLDLGMTGIIANISALLSAVSIPVFVISSFDTDYVLVRSEELGSAVSALQTGGIKCIPAGLATG